MAKRQFITLTAMLLFAATAHADILPRWGDRSCDVGGDVPCADTFPALIVDFYNPVTNASTRSELQFVGGGFYGIHFLRDDTEAYRTATGCLICDVYDGVFFLWNLDNEDGFVQPASVFTPFGFATDVDTARAVIAFDGEGLRLLEGVGWDGWTDSLDTFLYMRPDGTWRFETSNEDTVLSATDGLWNVHRDLPTARVTADEPPTFWLLLPGVMFLYLHRRLSRP